MAAASFTLSTRDLVGVRVALALAGLGAHADALLDVAIAALHDALLEQHRVLRAVYSKKRSA